MIHVLEKSQVSLPAISLLGISVWVLSNAERAAWPGVNKPAGPLGFSELEQGAALRFSVALETPTGMPLTWGLCKPEGAGSLEAADGAEEQCKKYGTMCNFCTFGHIKPKNICAFYWKVMDWRNMEYNWMKTMLSILCF